MGRPRQMHCLRGHSLEDAYVNKNGSRRCRQCAIAAASEYAKAKRANRPPDYVGGGTARPLPEITVDIATLAYAAGIIDGEGSIGVPYSVGPRKRRYHSLVVRVTSTDPGLTEWMRSHFGGTIRISHANKARQAPATTWSVTSRHAEVFLRKIRPYLVIKGDRADLAFAFRATVQLHGPASRITPEIFAERERIRLEIQRLNKIRRLSPDYQKDADTVAKEMTD